MIYQVLIVDDEEIVCRGLAQFVKMEKNTDLKLLQLLPVWTRLFLL